MYELNEFLSDLARNIEPYVPGEQPKDKKYIKLNTNENPYPPSPKTVEAIKLAADESLRLYPDPEAYDLRVAFANFYGLKPEQVYVGNGSDEVLAFCFMAFFKKQKHIIFPDITYSFYPVYANLFQIPYKIIPLNEEFKILCENYCIDNGGVIFANPNAPTGLEVAKDSIKKILECNMKNKSIVIIDEAYADFSENSSIELLKEYPNLVIAKTLSKSHSLAGLRVGAVFAHEKLIHALAGIKNSFNSYTVDRIAQAGAIAALKDTGYYLETREKIIKTRENFSQAVKAMGFTVLNSSANFVFMSHSSIKANYIFEELRKMGILVRFFYKPRIDNYLRITIGTENEMKILIEALKNIVDV